MALLTALIAAVAIGLAARRFAQRHLDGCAVMRAIGVRQRDLAILLLLELVWIGLIGGLVGAALGWAVHFGLAAAISTLIVVITSLLLVEHQRSATIDLRGFYSRRVKRLLPASLLLLAVVVVAAAKATTTTTAAAAAMFWGQA